MKRTKISEKCPNKDFKIVSKPNKIFQQKLCKNLGRGKPDLIFKSGTKKNLFNLKFEFLNLESSKFAKIILSNANLISSFWGQFYKKKVVP